MPALHSLCLPHTTTSLPIQPTQSPHSTHPTNPTFHPNPSPVRPQTLLHTLPPPSDQFKEKILCLEIMGIDSGKALSLNPLLQTVSLDAIHSTISFLLTKGIQHRDLPRIFGMCPKVLTADVRQDLVPVFNFLSRELAVSSSNYRKVILKCPRLLACSVRDQLKPALFYLRRLGFDNLRALAYQDPILLVSSVEDTLIPKLEYLVGIGFSREEAVGMVLRCPALFTFSIENNFKPKFEYFVEEMKGELSELKEFPQFFSFSLEKRIKPRHVELVQSGAEVPLGVMLKSTDEEFRELIEKTRNDGR